MPVIIDGYNLLWSIRKTSDEDSITDVELCRILSDYLIRRGERGQIVFDGTGPPEKTGFYNIRNLEVFFSGIDSDADTMIEVKIASDSAPKRLTIVSSDRRIRKAARARKATVVKSEVFWVEVIRQLSRKRRSPEPRGKREGIGSGETKQWLKFFGIEE